MDNSWRINMDGQKVWNIEQFVWYEIFWERKVRLGLNHLPYNIFILVTRVSIVVTDNVINQLIGLDWKGPSYIFIPNIRWLIVIIQLMMIISVPKWAHKAASIVCKWWREWSWLTCESCLYKLQFISSQYRVTSVA
jgi:hypothetical protein